MVANVVLGDREFMENLLSSGEELSLHAEGRDHESIAVTITQLRSRSSTGILSEMGIFRQLSSRTKLDGSESGISVIALELGEQLSEIDSEECDSSQNNSYRPLLPPRNDGIDPA